MISMMTDQSWKTSPSEDMIGCLSVVVCLSEFLKTYNKNWTPWIDSIGYQVLQCKIHDVANVAQIVSESRFDWYLGIYDDGKQSTGLGKMESYRDIEKVA